MTIDHVYEELHRLSYEASPEALAAAAKDKNDPLRIAIMKLRRYWKSEAAAEKFGFTGVGRISFADARLRRFEERIAKLKGR
jgi:hypothetical protein